MDWHKPVCRRPSGPTLTRLFCVFWKREYKLWTLIEIKKSAKMSRPSRWITSFLRWIEEKKKKRFLIVVQYALFKYCKYVLFRLSEKVWNTWCINHKMLIDWVLSGQTGNRPSNSLITYIIISRSRSVLWETTLGAMYEGFFKFLMNSFSGRIQRHEWSLGN